MDLPPWLETRLMEICDWVFSVWHQPVPYPENLYNCKIISHRGQHDNQVIFENTLPAFDRALQENGIWGIELDFRWTQDLCPVVSHDPHLLRLFGLDVFIKDLTQEELRRHCPHIPTLQEVLEKYGGKLHLMVEIKKEHYPDPDHQNRILKELFQPFQPKKDFHLLSLNHDMLEIINFVEASAKMLVAVFNEKKLSELALNEKYAGLGGHYLLLQNKMVQQHLATGQNIGVGYPKSKNSLFREINRGVEWIFSNDAVSLNNILQAEIRKIQEITGSFTAK